MAALSRATSLFNRSFNGRCPQKLHRIESCVPTSLGFDGRHLYGKVIYQGVPFRSHPALTGIKSPQQKQSVVGSLTSTSMASSRLTVPAAHSITSSRPGNTITPLTLKGTTFLASPSHPDAPGVDGTPQTPIIKHGKALYGSRYKTGPDIIHGHKCLHSSMDGFFVYVFSVLTCGFQPALKYLGGVLLTISLNTILFVLWVIFFH
ncbi:hypothetical protein F5Y00DRAFT_274040 [Daldinia vernicosa]|uniref:uncharacterized protein n=1 Tax=Daldinia vernicosa TaxID=114800 RepID=UPI002007C2FF|nr:uncharacterized protein F5Y00DRAFT_274040 [Daldinia vernicosa]KAI0844428.1 hypothetical protein F5Y00DRAFT_274040 [Daldinia vernicosa]